MTYFKIYIGGNRKWKTVKGMSYLIHIRIINSKYFCNCKQEVVTFCDSNFSYGFVFERNFNRTFNNSVFPSLNSWQWKLFVNVTISFYFSKMGLSYAENWELVIWYMFEKKRSMFSVSVSQNKLIFQQGSKVNLFKNLWYFSLFDRLELETIF